MINNSPYMQDKTEDIETLDRIIRYAKGSSYKQQDSELAKKMIDHYGSLRGVLTTDVHSLLRFEGVDKQIAVLVSMFYNVKNRIDLSKNTKIKYIKDTDTAKEYFRNILHLKTREFLYAVALDKRDKIIELCMISEGTINQAAVNTRKLIEFLLECDAAKVIISHNHPFSSPKPSHLDKLVTDNLDKALEAFGIELVDHIIVGKSSEFSIMTQCKKPLIE